MNALNPVYKVGDQIIEAMETHDLVEYQPEAAREHVASLFKLVGLDPQVDGPIPA